MRRDGEAGVALLTVLLIVLALSGISVVVLEDMRRGQRLEANASSVAQARWYALGADAYVRKIAADLRAGAEGAAFTEGERLIAYPLDHGTMEIRVRNASTCINLNGVVAGANDIYQRHQTGAAELQSLMTAAGTSEGEAAKLVDSLVAWIDTADGGRGIGRDDTPYLSQSPGYLTAREPLAEVSELRTVAGFSADVLKRIRPYVCVHPSVGPSSIDINALTPDDAPVLVALMQGALPEPTARRLISSRPPEGWAAVEDFWASPLFEGVDVPEDAQSRLKLQPDHLELEIRITHLDAEAVMSEALAWRNGTFVVASRRWSADT